MTLTTMRPNLDLLKRLEVLLFRSLQASSLIADLRLVFRNLWGSGAPRE